MGAPKVWSFESIEIDSAVVMEGSCLGLLLPGHDAVICKVRLGSRV